MLRDCVRSQLAVVVAAQLEGERESWQASLVHRLALSLLAAQVSGLNLNLVADESLRNGTPSASSAMTRAAVLRGAQ